ncbi:M23 family metallopeptidase [Stenotrophomonas nitritireducens]|uniref:M23 family metallopeptidase n=1 Tax=Stenotrophomonas nitritireducens TaxID=83617 RepID=UPI003D984EE9
MRTAACAAAVLAFIFLFAGSCWAIYLTWWEMDEWRYVDAACLIDMRNRSERDGVFKYRTLESIGGARWELDVGPVNYDMWFVHGETSPGVFPGLAGGKVVHLEKGGRMAFLSNSFDGGSNYRPFSYEYSYSIESGLSGSVDAGVEVAFPVRGESRVMQSAADGAARNYFGFKDWPRSHASLADINAIDVMAPQGTEIFAAAAGTVVEVSQENRDLGCRGDIYSALSNLIIILGDDGFQYVYAHVQKNSSFVKIGDRVGVGQKLALIGRSGGSREAHLHFSVQTMLDRGGLASVPLSFVACRGGYAGGRVRNGVVRCE